MLTSILLMSALSGAPALPTCDQVVEATKAEAAKAGFQYLGAAKAPGGIALMWGTKQQTLALVIVANPPADTKLFKFQGQCLGPKGDVGSVFSAVMPNQPPL